LIEEKTRSCTGKNPKRTTKKGENINDQINEKVILLNNTFEFEIIDHLRYF